MDVALTVDGYEIKETAGGLQIVTEEGLDIESFPDLNKNENVLALSANAYGDFMDEHGVMLKKLSKSDKEAITIHTTALSSSHSNMRLEGTTGVLDKATKTKKDTTSEVKRSISS